MHLTLQLPLKLQKKFFFFKDLKYKENKWRCCWWAELLLSVWKVENRGDWPDEESSGRNRSPEHLPAWSQHQHQGWGGPRSDHQSCSLCRQCCWWLIPYVSKRLVGAGFVPELRQRDFPKRVICPRTHPSETAGVCEWGGVVCAGIPISTTDTMRKTEDRAVPRKEMSSLSLQRLCGSLSVACPCLGVSGVCAHWHPPCSTVPSGTCTQPLLKAQVLVKNFYSFKEDPHWLS